MLLKLVSTASTESLPVSMKDCLFTYFSTETNSLQTNTKVPGVNALLASLQSGQGYNSQTAVFHFLEDVLARSSQKSAKYEDLRDEMCDGLETPGPVSHLIMTLIEQWPFAAGRPEQGKPVAEWLGRFLYACTEIGEDRTVLDRARSTMADAAQNKVDKKAIISPAANDIVPALEATIPLEIAAVVVPDVEGDEADKLLEDLVDASTMAPPSVDTKHAALHRWSSKDLGTALSDGDLSALLMCLSSPYEEVRVQALTNLRTIWNQLETTSSNLPDAKPIVLLILCVISTTKRLTDALSSSPVPSFLTVYAALAARVLLEPLHPLYDAINRFHITRGPNLSVTHLASYWTHKLLYTQAVPFDPTVSAKQTSAAARLAAASHEAALSLDNRFHDPALTADIGTPTMFLLNYIYHSLRTPADLDILHSRGTLEPLLGMAANPFTAPATLVHLFRILWRITCIEGGSDMLITRKGTLTWLEMQKAGARTRAGTVRRRGGRRKYAEEDVNGRGLELIDGRGIEALKRRIWNTCDRARMDEWSGGTLQASMTE